MIYGIAQYARYDMLNNPIAKPQKLGSTAAEDEKNKIELEERLSAVEKTLKTIITTLEKTSQTVPDKNVEEKTAPVLQLNSKQPTLRPQS